MGGAAGSEEPRGHQANAAVGSGDEDVLVLDAWHEWILQKYYFSKLICIYSSMAKDHKSEFVPLYSRTLHDTKYISSVRLYYLSQERVIISCKSKRDARGPKYKEGDSNPRPHPCEGRVITN